MSTVRTKLSSIQQQKVLHLFNILDVNYSGYVDKRDFRHLLRSLTNARDLERGTRLHNELEKSLMLLWDGISRMGDSSFDGRVDSDEWLRFFDHALSDSVFYEGLISPLENALISLLDTYGDGRISLADYRDVVLGMQPDVPEVAQLFQRLDTNRDGYITTDEASRSIREFFLSRDENTPGNYFFGEFAR